MTKMMMYMVIDDDDIYICCLLCKQHDNMPMQMGLQGCRAERKTKIVFLRNNFHIPPTQYSKTMKMRMTHKSIMTIMTYCDRQVSPSQSVHNSSPLHSNISSLASATIQEVISANMLLLRHFKFKLYQRLLALLRALTL